MRKKLREVQTNSKNNSFHTVKTSKLIFPQQKNAISSSKKAENFLLYRFQSTHGYEAKLAVNEAKNRKKPIISFSHCFKAPKKPV